MPSTNEGRCCDAVLRVLEQSTKAVRNDPHVDPGGGAGDGRVDVCVELDGTRYAIEHTRIEPFSEAIAVGTFLQKLVGEVTKELCADTPLPGPAYYELKLPLDPRFDGGGRSSGQHFVAREIADWIISVSASLFVRASEIGHFKPTSVKGEISGAITVHLICTPTGPPSETTPGEFGAVRDAPEAAEERLVVRLRKAVTDKYPKLWRCKNRGARTVLVLENDDILLDHISVREAMQQASNRRDDLPDETYLVDTRGGESWYVFPVDADADLSFGCDPYPDGLNHHRTFRFATLQDLSHRGTNTDMGCEFCVDKD